MLFRKIPSVLLWAVVWSGLTGVTSAIAEWDIVEYQSSGGLTSGSVYRVMIYLPEGKVEDSAMAQLGAKDTSGLLEQATRLLTGKAIDAKVLDRAADLLVKASTAGNTVAIYQLYSIDVGLRVDRSSRFIRPLAKTDPIAMVCMAGLDPKRGEGWLSQAAQKGYHLALLMLYYRYAGYKGQLNQEATNNFASAYRYKRIIETFAGPQAQPAVLQQDPLPLPTPQGLASGASNPSRASRSAQSFPAPQIQKVGDLYLQWEAGLRESQREALEREVQAMIRTNKLSKFYEVPEEMRGFRPLIGWVVGENPFELLFYRL